MIPRLFVVDANVVVAGIISSNVNSPVVQIVDAMLSGQIVFVLSPALLNEYRNVLKRPRLCKLHGLDKTEIDKLLTEITLNAVWREPVATEIAPDLGDNHLWDLLKQDTKIILVTGDQLLLDNPPENSSVILPASYIEMFC